MRPRALTRSRPSGIRGWLILAVVAFVVLSILWVVLIKSTEREEVIRVTDKERVTDCTSNSDGGTDCTSKYLIFTEDGTYENTDSWIYFKFSSSDLYGRLARGRAYRCKVVGWRVPFLSTYPKIISCDREPVA